jgi:Fic family protein
MADLREYFREPNAIEDAHDDSAVTATMDAWDAIRQEAELTHDVIKTGHDYILNDRQPDTVGEYRDVRVSVGDSTPPPPVVVSSEMDKLLSWVPEDPLEAVAWHIAFEHIHPFTDGNGRIGRLLYLWHCRTPEVESVVWRAADRSGYYDLFQTDVSLEHKTSR